MTTPTRSAALDKLLERHRIEAARLREPYGDPEIRLGPLVREMFEPGDLERAFWELTHGVSIFDDDERDER